MLVAWPAAISPVLFYLLQKHGAKVEQQAILPVRFVPMKRAQ
jgi:hypothetical protein